MAIEPTYSVNAEAQKRILAYAKGVMQKQQGAVDIRNKMEIIDKAYARYQEVPAESDGTPCGDVFASDKITAPIVVSQVDALVAYLADIFLSGYPLFPVVSTPANRKSAEALETVMDDHAILGGYARQLLLMLKDGVKYNLSAIETEWTSIENFSSIDDFLSSSGTRTV